MDLFRRVRWGNVGKAAALVAVVALIVLWPRLRSEPPELPVSGGAPLAPLSEPGPLPGAGEGEVVGAQAPRRTERPRDVQRRRGEPRSRAAPPRQVKRRRQRRVSPQDAPVAPSTPRPRPSAPAVAAPPPPGPVEFGFE